MRILLTVLLGLASSSPAFAEEDLALQSLVESFQQQRADLEAAELAIYADQLDHLEQQFTEKSDSASASKVQAESKVVREKLTAIKEARAKAHQAAVAKAREKDAKAGERIFADDDESAAAKLAKEKKAPVIRLRMLDAKVNPEGKLNREHWIHPDASAAWTITEAEPGEYRLRAVYRAKPGESGGKGELTVTGAPEAIPFSIRPTKGTWKELIQQDIGKLTIVQCPIEISLRSVGLSQADAPLFELVALWLVPEKGADPKRPAKPEATKKVDF